jgi:hypothetical protein
MNFLFWLIVKLCVGALILSVGFTFFALARAVYMDTGAAGLGLGLVISALCVGLGHLVLES